MRISGWGAGILAPNIQCPSVDHTFQHTIKVQKSTYTLLLTTAMLQYLSNCCIVNIITIILLTEFVFTSSYLNLSEILAYI